MGQSAPTPAPQATVFAGHLGNEFQGTVPGMTYTGIVTAGWAGNADFLPCSYWIYVGVKAKVTMSVLRVTHDRLRLHGEVTPLQPLVDPARLTNPTLIVFQHKTAHGWRRLHVNNSSRSDMQSWVATTYFGLKPGHYVMRARFHRH